MCLSSSSSESRISAAACEWKPLLSCLTFDTSTKSEFPGRVGLFLEFAGQRKRRKVLLDPRLLEESVSHSASHLVTRLGSHFKGQRVSCLVSQEVLRSISFSATWLVRKSVTWPATSSARQLLNSLAIFLCDIKSPLL